MFQLGGLPDDVDVVVGDFALDGKKVEQDVRLLDDLHVEVRSENVLHDLLSEDPTCQLEADVLDLDHALGVAHLVEQGYMRVDLGDATQPHRQRRRAEVLEGQLEAVAVERDRGRAVHILDGAPEEICDMSRGLLSQLAVREFAHVAEGIGSDRSEELQDGSVVEPELDVTQCRDQSVSN